MMNMNIQHDLLRNKYFADNVSFFLQRNFSSTQMDEAEIMLYS